MAVAYLQITSQQKLWTSHKRPKYLHGKMLANRFFTLLKGSFDTSWEATGSDPRDWKKKKNICRMKFRSAVHNVCPYLVLNLKASVSFCMHLLYMISETGDTDWFHSISHCWLRKWKILKYRVHTWYSKTGWLKKGGMHWKSSFICYYKLCWYTTFQRV